MSDPAGSDEHMSLREWLVNHLVVMHGIPPRGCEGYGTDYLDGFHEGLHIPAPHPEGGDPFRDHAFLNRRLREAKARSEVADA